MRAEIEKIKAAMQRDCELARQHSGLVHWTRVRAWVDDLTALLSASPRGEQEQEMLVQEMCKRINDCDRGPVAEWQILEWADRVEALTVSQQQEIARLNQAVKDYQNGFFQRCNGLEEQVTEQTARLAEQEQEIQRLRDERVAEKAAALAYQNHFVENCSVNARTNYELAGEWKARAEAAEARADAAEEKAFNSRNENEANYAALIAATKRAESLGAQLATLKAETTGAGLIAAERQRQIDIEKWTAGHDDQHLDAELVSAAICYAEAGSGFDLGIGRQARTNIPRLWPWEQKWWKPSGNLVRDLARAGALIAAEIDRLRRENQP